MELGGGPKGPEPPDLKKKKIVGIFLIILYLNPFFKKIGSPLLQFYIVFIVKSFVSIIVKYYKTSNLLNQPQNWKYTHFNLCIIVQKYIWVTVTNDAKDRQLGYLSKSRALDDLLVSTR